MGRQHRLTPAERRVISGHTTPFAAQRWIRSLKYNWEESGITARSFRPNLQKIRIRHEGKIVRATVCASCIKRGRVTKAISRSRKPA